jgi:hypothetical protein
MLVSFEFEVSYDIRSSVSVGKGRFHLGTRPIRQLRYLCVEPLLPEDVRHMVAQEICEELPFIRVVQLVSNGDEAVPLP